MKIVLLPLLLLLSACTMAMPNAPATPQDRIAAECALLTQAAAEMTAQGQPAHDGLIEGCPGTTARDTRPLPQQTASLRAANTAVLPSGVEVGSRAEQVFRRMITRGVPVSIASALTDTDAFARAAR